MARLRDFVAAATLLAIVAGCSGEQLPSRHPVRGSVTLDGKPLAEAMIVFHPNTETPGAAKPVAYSDPQGQFVLTTREQNDGAIAGEYGITVELRELRVVGDETIRDGKNVLPARYAKPETSGLRYTVVEGENTVPGLELKSR